MAQGVKVFVHKPDKPKSFVFKLFIDAESYCEAVAGLELFIFVDQVDSNSQRSACFFKDIGTK